MSYKGVLPFSSYFLWTQKGYTRIPLTRGSCYILDYDLQTSFYTKHIITAGHVAMPIKYQQCFGNTELMKGLGERHVTAKVLLGSTQRERARALAKLEAEGKDASELAKLPPSEDNTRVGRVLGDLNCNYKVTLFPTTDVAQLTFKQEGNIKLCPPHIAEMFASLTPDLGPIQPGEELIAVGYDMDEDSSAPHDGFLTMRQVAYDLSSVAAIETQDYGTVVVCAATGEQQCGGANNGGLSSSTPIEREIPASISGGAVIRKSTGGVVGTIAARTTLVSDPLYEGTWGGKPAADGSTTTTTAEQRFNNPNNMTREMDGRKVPFREPCVNISGFERVAQQVGDYGIAFTPINEFYNGLRKLE